MKKTMIKSLIRRHRFGLKSLVAVMGLGTALFSLSSCADEKLAVDDDFASLDNGMTEMTLAFDFSCDEAEVRSRELDFTTRFINIADVWVGVYDIQTGNRVGCTDFYLGRGAQPDNVMSTYDSKVSIIYYDAHPEVRIVSVANYEGLTTPDGQSLLDELNAADNWDAFLKVSFAAAEEESKQNSTQPLLTGFYFNDGHNGNTSQCRVNQLLPQNDKGEKVNVYDNANDAATRVNLTAGTSGSNRPRDPEYNRMKTLTGSICLRRVRMQADVNIQAGNGVEISNLTYRQVNIPQFGYIMPRRVLTPSNWSGTYSDDWADLSPNKGDNIMSYDADGNITSINGAYVDTEEKALTAENGTYSFSFQHLENRHWALTDEATDYASRMKMMTGDDGTKIIDPVTGHPVIKALAPEGATFNSMISGFILTMDVKSPSGIAKDVTYFIPEGYRNETTGATAYDVPTRAKDYMAVRNTHYTYNITINGIEDLKVNVTTGGESHRDDMSAGHLYIVDDKEPKDYNEFIISNVFTIPETGAFNVWYRLYEVTTHNEIHDFWSWWSREDKKESLLAQFDGMWPEFEEDFNHTPAETFKDIEAVWENGSTNLQDFMTTPSYWGNHRGESISIRFKKYTSKKGSPHIAFRSLYIFNVDDLENGVMDEDGCTLAHTITGYMQKTPQDERDQISLPPVSQWLDASWLTATKFVQKEITLSIPAPTNNDLKDGAYYHLTFGDYEPESVAWQLEDPSVVEYKVPVANIKNKAVVSLLVEPMDDDHVASDNIELGQTNITAPNWKAGDPEWDAALNYFGTTAKAGNYQGTYLHVYAQDGKTWQKNGNTIRCNGAGTGGQAYIGFTPYKSCTVNVTAQSNSSGTARPVVIEYNGKEVYRENVDGSTPISYKIEYDPTIEPAPEVRICSGSGGIAFTEIKLSD